MSRYFNAYDYDLLPQNGKDIVDAWMADNNIDPTMVSLVEGDFEDSERLIVSGVLDFDTREAIPETAEILHDLPEDTFPWEEIAPYMTPTDSEGIPVPEAEDIPEATEEFVVEGVAYGSNV